MDLPKVCSRLQQVDMNRRRKEGREKGRKGERKKERKISGGMREAGILKEARVSFYQRYNSTSGRWVPP
jgi:hypothetical protein